MLSTIFKIIKFFNSPYPLDLNIQSNIKRSLSIGIFVFVFFYMFQPFGLSNVNEKDKLILFAGYSILTFFSIFCPIQIGNIVKKKFNIDVVWNIWKQISLDLALILIISISLYVYSNMFFEKFINFFMFICYVFFIGIIPITTNVLLQYYYYLKKNINLSNHLSDQYIKKKQQKDLDDSAETKIISLFSIDKGKKYDFNVSDLVYFNSLGNYVNVFYIKQDLVKQDIIRNTLKEILNQLNKRDNFFLCHRSYIVNINKIKSFSGNAQGLKLILEKCKNHIPVSRTYIKKFQEIIEK